MKIAYSILTGLMLTLCAASGGQGKVEIHPSLMPYTISDPGSYLVTGELVGQAGAHGISIEADGVTLDLNGFTLRGVTNSLHGIHAPAARQDIRIVNGIIRGWGQDGIHATNVVGGLYRDLLLSDNGDTGLRTGFGSEVEACLAYRNGGLPGASPGTPESNEQGDGFHIENGSIIRASTALDNNHHALNAHSGSLVEYVALRANGHDGLHGSHGTTVRGCSSCLNSEGIEIDSGGLIAFSVSCDNQEDGLRIKKEETDTLFGGAVIVGSVAYRNGLLPAPEGGEGGDNIDVRGFGNRVEGCVAVFSDGHGIRVRARSAVVANLSGNNAREGGDGLRVKERGNRIEGNHLVSNLDDGIQASENDFNVEGNWFSGNSAFNNLDEPYNIEAGNHWTGQHPALGLPADNPAVNFGAGP